ncbi:uncharacterized protein LOC132279984 [Cornus florida]|uniref:uncharacterized protein LOC132279984 n=1 Tax=Cornus florida TaxID=4283 RepID=UPI002898EAD1|nr:uncharacterized protein LOC132279984 [Cornus florida]
MEILPFVLHFQTLWLLMFIFRLASSYVDFEAPDNPSIMYTYNRCAEIEKQCGSILSSASELEPDDNRGDRLRKEHFFLNGDWYQESGGAPFMPFGVHDMPGPPMKLVSFWIMDVDPVCRAKNAISISGALEIAKTRRSLYSSKPYQWSPKFYTARGISSLTILFEGIYIETEDNGGKHLMCLLGNATMPTSSQFVDSLESMHEYGEYRRGYKYEPTLVQDDQIMLVLRYPKAFTLSARVISGEMQSMNQKWNLTYFDKIHISSQLVSYSNYQFGAVNLLSKACSPYPHQDNLVMEDVKMFTGDGLCEKLMDVELNDIFNIMPNLECIGWKDCHGKLGPFVLDRKIEASDEDFNQFKLIIQNLHCEARIDENEMKTARVSAVFQVFSSSKYWHREAERTGLSSMTLSAEGIWHSSDGQLCMVGCLGQVGGRSERCSYRICLYIPLTFSIKQRSMVFGTISSINETDSHTSLMFDIAASLKYFSNNLHWSRNLKCSYRYSKIMQASQFQKRSKPSILGTILRNSFLQYPSPKGNDEASFTFLSDALSNRLCAVPQTLLNAQTSRTFVKIEVVSLGSSCGRYWPHLHEEKHEIKKPVYSNSGN